MLLITGFAESSSKAEDAHGKPEKSITVVLDAINHKYVIGAGRQLQDRTIPSEYKTSAGTTNLGLHAYLSRMESSGKMLTNEKDFGLSFEAKMGHHYTIRVAADVPDPEQYGIWVFDQLGNVVGGVSLRQIDK